MQEVIDRACKEFADSIGMDDDEFDREARYSNPFQIIARLRQALGAREHSGRVPTAGFGATPSQVYGTRYRNMEVGESSGSQSYEDRQRDERLQKELEERDRRLREEFYEQNREERERLQREREDLERRMSEFEQFRQQWEERECRRQERHRRRRRGPGGS